MSESGKFELDWSAYLAAKADRAKAALPPAGRVITARECRPPLWLLLFSRRERWFWRHRNCQLDVRRGQGYESFWCLSWTCGRRLSRWTDHFPV